MAIIIILIICAGYTSFKSYEDWINEPVITTVSSTGLPIVDVPFPTVVFCAQGKKAFSCSLASTPNIYDPLSYEFTWIICNCWSWMTNLLTRAIQSFLAFCIHKSWHKHDNYINQGFAKGSVSVSIWYKTITKVISSKLSEIIISDSNRLSETLL